MAATSKTDIECKLLPHCEKLDYYKHGIGYFRFSLHKHRLRTCISVSTKNIQPYTVCKQTSELAKKSEI